MGCRGDGATDGDGAERDDGRAWLAATVVRTPWAVGMLSRAGSPTRCSGLVDSREEGKLERRENPTLETRREEERSHR